MQDSCDKLHCCSHLPTIGADALEDMRRIAFETVLRACGFGSLTIFCIMIGLSFDPLVAFQSGGVLTTVMTGILVLKAYEARTKPYRRTEMWLYLPQDSRPPEAIAQRVTGALMREVYLNFALWTSITSIVMWSIAVIFSYSLA
jgi:hypothetical protein